MTSSDTAQLRRTVYWMIGTIAVAVAIAKVVGVENVVEPSRFNAPSAESYGPDPDRARQLNMRDWPEERPEPSPMFGSNDRSRWATIRALVEDGTYVIGQRDKPNAESGYKDTGRIFEPGFTSVDKVMDRDTGNFYSSKPPLLPTLLAGEYWILHNLLGWSMDEDRWWVVCVMLLTVNVLPFGLFLVCLARLLEEYGKSDFGRIFVFAVASFATFQLTFVQTLNNHSPAIWAVMFSLYFVLPKPSQSADPGVSSLFLSGFFAALAVTFELPVAALMVGLFVPLLMTRPKAALVGFLPGMLIPIIAHFICTYLALGRLTPMYSEFGGPMYNYPGSHWAKAGTPAATGIDFIDEPKTVYLFHLLFGHHGWFSLTPVWLAALFGLLALSWKSGAEWAKLVTGAGKTKWPWNLTTLASLTLVVSVVVFAFYTKQTNNYGGNTSGPRWLFWLMPLWLFALLPTADWLGRTAVGRSILLILLAVSVVSVFYPAWNPWRSPIIMVWMQGQGLIDY